MSNLDAKIETLTKKISEFQTEVKSKLSQGMFGVSMGDGGGGN